MPDVAAPVGPTLATLATLAAEGATVLARAGVADAARESRELLAALADAPRSWVLTEGHAPVDDGFAARARAAFGRRAAGAPLAYAVGRASFRALVLEVDERVLIPRPETEQLVDLVLDAGITGGGAVDVGTGSGAIALALAAEGRFERVIATDISRDALAVAGANAERLAPALRVPVELRAGSLLAPLGGLRARAVVSNPPYIALHEAPALPPSVRDWEPAVALFGGEDGMWHLARLVAEAAGVLEDGGLLALEVDSRRAHDAAALARRAGLRDVAVRQDLFGRDRFVLARR